MLQVVAADRDEILEAVNDSYAQDLASGGNPVELHREYLAERNAVISKFNEDANAIFRDYNQRAGARAEPLPELQGPGSPYPDPTRQDTLTVPPPAHAALSSGSAGPGQSTQKPVRRGRPILGVIVAGLAILALISWIDWASRAPVSSSSGSGTSSAVTSTTRTVTYEVVGGAKGATITYQAPTGTAQATIKVPLATKSGEMVTFEMDRGDFVYISAQNKGTSGNIICRISVDGKVISTVTSSGSYAIASCDGTVP